MTIRRNLQWYWNQYWYRYCYYIEVDIDIDILVWSKNPRRPRLLGCIDIDTILILKSILILFNIDVVIDIDMDKLHSTSLIQKSKTSAAIGLDVKTRGFWSRQWYRHKRYHLQIFIWINFSLANINRNQYIFFWDEFPCFKLSFLWMIWLFNLPLLTEMDFAKICLPSARDHNSNNFFVVVRIAFYKQILHVASKSIHSSSRCSQSCVICGEREITRSISAKIQFNLKFCTTEISFLWMECI